MPSRAVLAVGLLLLAVGFRAPGAAPGTARPVGHRQGAAGLPGPSSAPGPSSGPGAYLAPVTPLRVLRAFRAPASRYGPGHRGVDVALGPGAAVRSAGAGVVRFAGSVAGRGVIVVAHSDGIATEYEPVRPTVRTGSAVRAGQVLGFLRGRHPGCSAGCLHWGARHGSGYFDPLTLLRPLGPVVLLPWPRDG
jgi:murein DD-endopeptidase MepM/ murein hydrolase activator NlpD